MALVLRALDTRVSLADSLRPEPEYRVVPRVLGRDDNAMQRSIVYLLEWSQVRAPSQ